MHTSEDQGQHFLAGERSDVDLEGGQERLSGKLHAIISNLRDDMSAAPFLPTCIPTFWRSWFIDKQFIRQ